MSKLVGEVLNDLNVNTMHKARRHGTANGVSDAPNNMLRLSSRTCLIIKNIMIATTKG